MNTWSRRPPCEQEVPGEPGLADRLGQAEPADPHRSHRRRRLRSAQILGGSDEVEIEHAGAVYRLRVTSLGKLILTK